MKKLILLCCLVFNGSILFGQTKKISKKDKQLTTEVGLNATFLARNFFGAPEDVTSISDYLLYYKIIKGKNAFRFGIGGSANQRAEELSGQTQQEILATILNARMGYERRDKLGEKWLYYYGVDLVLHYDKLEFRTVTSIDDTKTSDKYLEGGAGPILGLQFMLNEHIGISTEAGLFYFFSTFSGSDTFTNFPEINTSRRFDEFRIAAIAPTNIYISVKF